MAQVKEPLDSLKSDSLKTILEEVNKNDQQPRLLLDTLEKKYGVNSAEVALQWKHIHIQDSINQIIVTSIINKYGWLSANESSLKAHNALFQVVQHAEIDTQFKYLPILKDAVKERKAKPSDYAYLSDRVKMRLEKYQTYGTQLGGDYEGNLCFWPIEDEPNVNKRRKEFGLTESIEEYAKNFNINYRAPGIDSLKGNIIINGYVSDKDQHGVDSVKVYTSKNKFLIQTNRNGTFKLIVSKSVAGIPLVFKKQGFKPATYTIRDKNKDIFYIECALVKL